MATETTSQAQAETNREAERVEQARAPRRRHRRSASAQPQPTLAEAHRDGGEQPTRSLTLTLPFIRARFEVPRPSSGPFHMGPMTLPSPGKAIYYVGLGALVVAEIVEWPVAVAIGAGTYVAQHTRADEPALPHMEHAGHPDTRTARNPWNPHAPKGPNPPPKGPSQPPLRLEDGTPPGRAAADARGRLFPLISFSGFPARPTPCVTRTGRPPQSAQIAPGHCHSRRQRPRSRVTGHPDPAHSVPTAPYPTLYSSGEARRPPERRRMR
jgi:hypothetical protein